MTTQRMPTFHTVALLQLQLLYQMKYAIGLTLILVWGVVGLHVFSDPMPSVPWTSVPVLIPLHVTIVFLGGVAAVLVWHNEAPQNRRYHWAMPVKRELHDILRIVAGAFWLMVAIGIYATLAWFLEDPAIRERWLSNAPFFWLSIFITPLLMYLLASIAALMAGRPLMWLGGIIAVIAMLSLPVAEEYLPSPVIDMRTALFSEKYPPSLGVALAGGYLAAPWHDGERMYEIYKATKDETFARLRLSAEARANTEMNMSALRRQKPDVQPSEWLLSIGLWFVVALLGLAIALRRRPDI